MKENKDLILSDMEKLKEEFRILKEKIKNTLIEKRKLLQAKCEVGLKKASDFINIHKSDATAAVKTAVLTFLICVVASFQFQLTMNEDKNKVSPELPIENIIVTQATDYGIVNPSDVFKTNKDFFEALDETKNIVEEVQKLAKGISTVQKTREYNNSNSNSVVEKSSLEDKYQLINALAEKLKLNKKNKEKKELNKDRDFDKIDIESSSNRELDISIIEEIDEDKFFRIEKKDIDGDGIEDDVYIVDIGNGSKVPYKSVCYNRDDKVKDSKIEEYER